jgi:SAM-dependent methyltransferase
MTKMLEIAWLALQERVSSRTLCRQPEPSAAMDDGTSVHAFHDAGTDDGPLIGVYEFNARAIHALTAKDATVVDLGCGSGRFLAHLARRRTDLKFIGFDLSPAMIAVGQEMLRSEGLADRVRLRTVYMTTFENDIDDAVDLVTSIFSLHHLPTVEHLDACVSELAKLRRRSGAAVWIFDHARPRSISTASSFPEIFTPEAPQTFRLDSSNSLQASWSFAELRVALATQLDGIQSRAARLLPVYQAHWLENSRGGPFETTWNRSKCLSNGAIRDAKMLARLLGPLPGW